MVCRDCHQSLLNLISTPNGCLLATAKTEFVAPIPNNNVYQLKQVNVIHKLGAMHNTYWLLKHLKPSL